MWGLIFCECMTCTAEYKPTTFSSNLSGLHFTQQPTLAEVIFSKPSRKPTSINSKVICNTNKVNILHSNHSAMKGAFQHYRWTIRSSVSTTTTWRQIITRKPKLSVLSTRQSKSVVTFNPKANKPWGSRQCKAAFLCQKRKVSKFGYCWLAYYWCPYCH